MFRQFLQKGSKFAVVGIGCGVTGSVGAALSQSTAHGSEFPPFSLGGTRYSQETYVGRLRTILEMIDPRTLFISDAQVEQCQHLLKQFEEKGAVDGVTDHDLWNAQGVVSAVIHPPTGEKMFGPGRMSAFLPMNVPIAAGMLMHGPTGPMAAVFWQWMNQSYNVVNNFTNRAGSTVDIPALMKSYGLAVGASVSIALASAAAFKKYPALLRLGPFVPYLAVITAGATNVSFTRMEEMTKGISVADEDGNELGISTKAGQLAVWNTVCSRSVFLPIFPLLIPPTVMTLLKKNAAVRGNKQLAVVLEILVITFALGLGLPCALAVLPQRMEIDVEKLEPKFQGLTNSKGDVIKHAYANKGL